MKPYVEADRYVLFQGDCAAGFAELPDASIDAVVCDPPYELAFMGKAWDGTGIAYSVEFWREVLRVLKPGGHLLAFGGTRTYHRMTCAIEDAGFEIRDSLHWMYGTGFPKSLDVSKAMDNAAGAVRPVIGKHPNPASTKRVQTMGRPEHSGAGWQDAPDLTAPATDLAKQWQGWGTALKPAHEPIVLARKPLLGTVAANVAAHGTGALNIDGCRIATTEDLNGGAYSKDREARAMTPNGAGARSTEINGEYVQPSGRWPANVLLDEEAAAELDAQVIAAGARCAKGDSAGANTGRSTGRTSGHRNGLDGGPIGYGQGVPGASRFFYVAKPSRAERDVGCEHLPAKSGGEATDREDDSIGTENPRAGAGRTGGARNHHPTVKPVQLMRYLVRLVTPPGGVVLDPFLGSGTTGIAALQAGFDFVGVEREPEYLEIAKARIAAGASLKTEAA